MQNFNQGIFSKNSSYHEPTVRKEFAQLMQLRTIVIYCYDPRAMDIPEIVAKEFGDIYPGETVFDEKGNGVGTTATLLRVIVAGGRAMDALRSITVGQHLLNVKNVVVVHHTHCGATSYTTNGIINAFKKEHGTDISNLYPLESVCISDFEQSLIHDVQLIRDSAGTPKHVDIYGYVYDIDTLELTKVTEDLSEESNYEIVNQNGKL